MPIYSFGQLLFLVAGCLLLALARFLTGLLQAVALDACWVASSLNKKRSILAVQERHGPPSQPLSI